MGYRRSLAGITSRAPGRRVRRAALSGITSRAPGPPVSRLALGSLGGDTLGAMTEEEWRAKMLEGQRVLIQDQKAWADGDRLQKWIAIGATLAIPLSAAVWRAIGIGRRRRP